MIKIGEWLNDYKAKMVYLVLDAKEIKGKTVILGETHTSQNTPCIGYDVIILDYGDVIPDSEKWGEKAWSYRNYEEAESEFQKIC